MNGVPFGLKKRLAISKKLLWYALRSRPVWDAPAFQVSAYIQAHTGFLKSGQDFSVSFEVSFYLQQIRASREQGSQPARDLGTSH